MRATVQTPCEVIEMLNRRRAAIQAFLVEGLRDPPGRRRCRLLEESVVLDRSARLVDVFLRAIRAEAAALGEVLARWTEDGRREGFSPFDWPRALSLLEEKVAAIVSEEAADPGTALGRVAAVLASARERLGESRATQEGEASPPSLGEAPSEDRVLAGAGHR